MKFVLVLAALAVVASALPLQKSLDAELGRHWFEFGRFVEEHKKSYTTDEEMSRRFEIFSAALARIEAHNARNDATYTMGVNEFTDLTFEEFAATHLGFFGNATTDAPEHIIGETPVANAVDWRSRLPAIKNQGTCGSCWAFSAAASMEFKCGGSRSEQQLVDCVTSCSGCGGGLPEYAFNYVAGKGEESESAYPYTGRDGTCKYAAASADCHVSGYRSVRGEAALESAASGQVVSVGVAVGADFQNYRSGIFSGGCAASLNHAINVVGYDTGYWLLRNSWGTSWGEAGYMRMARGSNVCGIANQGSYPY